MIPDDDRDWCEYCQLELKAWIEVEDVDGTLVRVCIRCANRIELEAEIADEDHREQTTTTRGLDP